MFKLFALILVSAVCMSPVVQGSAVAATAKANEVQNINPALMDYYGYQIGYPLLAPYLGPLTSLHAAAMPARSYIGQSNPVLIRGNYLDQFIGESAISMIAL